jgi:hypothetical protein
MTARNAIAAYTRQFPKAVRPPNCEKRSHALEERS